MNAQSSQPASQYGGMLAAGSFGVGALISAALLYEHHNSAIGQYFLEFGAWMAGFGHFRGFWPALLAVSLLCGLLLFVIVAAIAPSIEEAIARQGMERSQKALSKDNKLSVEEEMQLLVKKFGQQKPK